MLTLMEQMILMPSAPKPNLDPSLKPKNPKKVEKQIGPESFEYFDNDGVFKDFNLIPALHFRQMSTYSISLVQSVRRMSSESENL